MKIYVTRGTGEFAGACYFSPDPELAGTLHEKARMVSTYGESPYKMKLVRRVKGWRPVKCAEACYQMFRVATKVALKPGEMTCFTHSG